MIKLVPNLQQNIGRALQYKQLSTYLVSQVRFKATLLIDLNKSFGSWWFSINLHTKLQLLSRKATMTILPIKARKRSVE